jgi:hypothetical protein
MTALTAMGALARGRRWSDPVTGRFLPEKFVAEAATAAGLAVVAIGMGNVWHVEPSALAAICVGCGWLGPDTVSSFLLKKIGGSDAPKV